MLLSSTLYTYVLFLRCFGSHVFSVRSVQVIADYQLEQLVQWLVSESKLDDWRTECSTPLQARGFYMRAVHEDTHALPTSHACIHDMHECACMREGQYYRYTYRSAPLFHITINNHFLIPELSLWLVLSREENTQSCICNCRSEATQYYYVVRVHVSSTHTIDLAFHYLYLPTQIIE